MAKRTKLLMTLSRYAISAKYYRIAFFSVSIYLLLLPAHTRNNLNNPNILREHFKSPERDKM